MAWLSGWAKRLKITVDADLIDAALSNFPVPVYISAASGIGDVDASCVFDELTSDANRKKIAVTTSDGETQCYVEIERWDDANEKAWLHVKLPSVSESADTDLYLYYDSTQADNTTYVGDTGDASAEAVWSENYLAVYHMADATTSTVLDSTSNDYDGTKGAASNPAEADEKFGKGQNYDASGERIELGDVLDLEYNQTSTIEALTKTSSNAYGMIFSKMGAGTAYQGYALAKFDSANGNTIWFDLVNNWTSSYRIRVKGSTNIADGNWRHVAVTYSGNNAASGVDLYVNGAAESDSTVYDTLGARSTVNAVTASIGNRYEYSIGGTWIGDLDEIRVSSVVRSAAWLKATYNGLFDSLLTFGTEELAEILAEITDAAALAETIDAVLLAAAITDGARLGDALDAYYLRDTITDGAGLSDAFDPLLLVEAITDGAGLSDAFDPLLLVEAITDGAGLGDALVREIEAALSITDGAGLGDDVVAYDLRAEQTDGSGLGDSLARIAEYYPGVADGAGLGDSVSCLNWSEWLRQNVDLAIKRFYFTLTGDGETPAVADAIIPISSFQARLRQGEPTYLSVVVPDLDAYSAIISARSHGQMVIDMALLLDDIEAVREEICRVYLEDINVYEGARNKSKTLSGHATETYATKITALTGASYYNLSGGLRRYRCAMDPYLKPGDTVRVNDEEFEVGYITISRSVGSETMEVVEAKS